MIFKISMQDLSGEEAQVSESGSVIRALIESRFLADLYGPMGYGILIRDEDGGIVFDSDFHEVYLDRKGNLQIGAKKKARIEA